MLTIFAIPKPFVRLNGIIQRNAIRSWKRLRPECEIILFGDDDGVEETAHEFGVRHIPAVEKNEYGTPLLSSVFHTVQEIAHNDTIMYTNADMIYTSDLTRAIEKIALPQYLLCGRRWDLDIKTEINFNDDGWTQSLLNRIRCEGKLHGPSGVDYFVFPQHSINMLPFAVGRAGWDGWLLYERRSRQIPVIDATKAIPVVHQNHDYSHSQYGGKTRVIGPEWERNIELAGGFSNFLTLRDADWLLDRIGLRRPDFPGRIISVLSRYYPYRLLLSVKRNLQERFRS